MKPVWLPLWRLLLVLFYTCLISRAVLYFFPGLFPECRPSCPENEVVLAAVFDLPSAVIAFSAGALYYAVFARRCKIKMWSLMFLIAIAASTFTFIIYPAPEPLELIEAALVKPLDTLAEFFGDTLLLDILVVLLLLLILWSLVGAAVFMSYRLLTSLINRIKRQQF